MIESMTMKELSELLGISIATVSNALTGTGRISNEKRQEVIEAAIQHGYDVNKIRSKQRTKEVSVIIEDCCSPFTQDIVRGICQEAEKVECIPTIYHLNLPDKTDPVAPDIALMRQHVQNILNQQLSRTSGIIYVSSYSRNLTGLFPELPVPIVYAYGYTTDQAACVNYDDAQGAYLATSYLIKSGCKRIAMISGPIDSIAMTKRLEGYQRALFDGGLLFDPTIITVGTWDRQNGYDSMVRLLATDTPPDGVFCQNDYIAAGAMAAAREKGVKVPDELSVIGFDNSRVSSYLEPPLTTVIPPCVDIGRQAFLTLMKKRQSPSSSLQTVKLPCSLKVRQSTR